jgi:alanyl-tRNA synthetase
VTGDEIRQAFLEFFEERGHKTIPLVGDNKHLTFFEMLGNFSVGDYFKKEAISWAWEFVTQRLKLPEERLWVTVYLDDDEAFAYWRQIGVRSERILRFGEEDNFWGPAGDSGPCGPCSEIHYDFGEEFGCGRPECKPNCDCGRFSEIWNLVFTQYDQDRNGERSPLPKPNIDTGMGLERTVAATQDKASVYGTDIFVPLTEQVCRLSGKSYGQDEDVDRATRIVAEHGRATTFLIADGVLPSNEGRGYVLRRVLRRACLFGRRLGLDQPFLSEIAEVVVDRMSHVYPELMDNRALIKEVIEAEEDRFIAVLDIGLGLVENLIDDALAQGRERLSGEEVFTLYDTYGFPGDLTAEVAKERGLSIDWESFRQEMERQRERARAATMVITPPPVTVVVTAFAPDVIIGGSKVPSTEFVGYEATSSQSKLLELRVGGQWAEIASQGDEVDIILDKTPFYGEMGGQVGDTGEISSRKGKVTIVNTVRSPSDMVLHHGRVIEGGIAIGDDVEAKVDVARRLDIARNHTATHLLQAALRGLLGAHVYQRGSLVEAQRFRFDFSHLATISEEQLAAIREWVNERIRQNLPVKGRDVRYSQAISEGAMALFGEKYGETVRVVEIGEPAISRELCGGTHVKSTGEIGFFLISSEGSIGTGLRRIEASTGRFAESLIEGNRSALQNMAKEIGSLPEEVHNKVRALANELEQERKRSLWLERELSAKIAESLLGQTKEMNGVTVLAAEVPPLTMPVLREMGDILRDRLKSAVVVLATVHNDKPSFLAMVTPDLVAKGFHAGEIVKQVAKATGGSGGGKATMAQAGGKDSSKLGEALNLVESVIGNTAKQSRET